MNLGQVTLDTKSLIHTKLNLENAITKIIISMFNQLIRYQIKIVKTCLKIKGLNILQPNSQTVSKVVIYLSICML